MTNDKKWTLRTKGRYYTLNSEKQGQRETSMNQDESEPASLKLENTNKKSNTNEILIQAKKFLLKIKLCY